MRNTVAQPSALRVLLVTPRYFPYVGGVETHTAEVAQRLTAAGNEVTVLTTDPGRQLPVREQSAGVQLLRVPAWPANRDYYFAPGIYRLIARGNWSIVHCQGYHTLVPPVAMLSAHRARIPYVLTFHSGGHSSRLRNAVRGAQQLALRPLLARANRLIGVSYFEVELFRRRLRLPREQFVVIPNGASLPPASPALTVADNHGTLILAVGRLERYKGHHRIIAAMPRVLEQWPDARLQIVGTGPYEGALRQLVARLRLTAQVEITSIDGADRAAMARLLSQAALVTLLSDYEAHPIAVMEALALGRPVLVNYTSGLAELADHGLVRAVPQTSSVEEVAAAILDALHQPFVPEGVLLPTWDDCVTNLLKLYHDVVREAQCAS